MYTKVATRARLLKSSAPGGYASAGATSSQAVVPHVIVSQTASAPGIAPCQWRSSGGVTTSVPGAISTAPSTSLPIRPRP